MSKCPTCGAPARHTAPDGDFRYCPPTPVQKQESQTVSEARKQIPNAVLDAVAKELQMTWGVGVENPTTKPVGYRNTWREIARPVAEAALAALEPSHDIS